MMSPFGSITTRWPNVPPRSKPAVRGPSIISGAPTRPDAQDFSVDQSRQYLEMVGQLSAENEQLRADNDRLRGQQTYEDVRARMMEPYAGKVFNFLIGYCLFVACVILLSGFRVFGFFMSDAVLGIVAGSTAASAIGLVGFVVSGLFGAAKAARAGPR
jgi:hypothetical protein